MLNSPELLLVSGRVRGSQEQRLDRSDERRKGKGESERTKSVKVLITLEIESMLRDRECYYILALVNKVVRSSVESQTR